ncbi:MAG: 50S ribosomal protein L25 [Planctomycetota bacterium]
MKILDLSVEKRESLGSAASRRVRRAWKIPCVLYGNKQAAVPLAASVDDFEKILKAHTRVVNLRLGDQTQTALVRQVYWHAYEEAVEHVDFVRIEMTDEVTVTVPMRYTGVPAGVPLGGVAEVVVGDLEVRCRADSIPDELRVEVSHLQIGQGVHLNEVSLPRELKPTRPPGTLLFHVVLPRKIEEAAPAAPAEGEAAPAEGAAAPAEEGGKAGASASKEKKEEKAAEKKPAAEKKGGKEKGAKEK